MVMSKVEAREMNPALVVETREGSITTLRMNRPDRLNALNVDLCQALLESLQRAGEDASVRVVILTGEGRGFCSGGDLAVLREACARSASCELEELLIVGKEITLEMAKMPKPVLAVVNGPAAGAGMNLALACDLRIASEKASFGETFAQVGLFPDFGGTFYLPRLVGAARAAELFFTGRMITAGCAAGLGIVNRAVPHEEMWDIAWEMARDLAAAPPLAVRAVKHCLVESHLKELERALDEEMRVQAECFGSQDALEGLNAFFEKRRPVFHGR
jgi:2-(1,2-epoxy-1,2-dihydrophenyl)acetyl-CoA isomerase